MKRTQTDAAISLIASRPFAVLAGAGVSCGWPSNLPTAGPIIDCLMEALSPQQGARPKAPPFELAMEFLARSTGGDVSFLRFLGQCRSPNTLHHFLAACVINGHPVITANFDGLIEEALRRRGVRPTVVATTARFRNALRRPPRFPVWKIHGSFEDEGRRDISDSIRATLTAVTQSGLGFEWEPARLRLLHKLLSGRVLLVLGYSGSDDLDILPALLATSGFAGIVWIRHDGDAPLTACRWDATSNASDERGRQFLNLVVGRDPAPRVIEVTGSTHRFVARLSERLGYRPTVHLDSEFRFDWPRGIQRWARRHFRALADRWEWLAYVWAANQRYEKELHASKRALALERRRAQLGRRFYNVGKAYTRALRHEAAHEAFRRALEVSRRGTGPLLRLGTLAALAAVEARLHRPKEAVRYARRALAMTTRRRIFAAELAPAYYALAMADLAAGRDRSALRRLGSRVLPSFQCLGDLRGYIAAAEQVSVIQRRLHMHAAAVRTAERALAYARASRDAHEIGHAHIFCARAFGETRRWAEAEAHANAALRVAAASSLGLLAIHAYRYLAWIHADSGSYRRAARFYERVLRHDFAHRTDEYPKTLTNLACVYMKLHRARAGLRLFRSAERSLAARKLGIAAQALHRFAFVTCLGEARHLMSVGRRRSALRLLEEAFQHARKAGDMRRMKRCLREVERIGRATDRPHLSRLEVRI